MTHRIRIYRAGVLVRETYAAPGESLLRRISIAGVHPDAPCGGNSLCGKCLARLSPDPDSEQVLLCRTIIKGDVDVYLPDDTEMMIADGFDSSDRNTAESSTTDHAAPDQASPACNASAPDQAQPTCDVFAPDQAQPARDASASDQAQPARVASAPDQAQPPRPPSLRRKLGIAIDIGTTTVVAHLTDMETCERIATASGVNAQRSYGADVISRIRYCADNGHETLTELIREQIDSLIRQTCAASGEHPRDIGYISIAANTTMEHLAAGYSPVGMGLAPFNTISLFGYEHPVWYGSLAAINAVLYFAPAVTAYVGGDITAGMLAAGLEDMPGPDVYLDIGTNGEIVMKKDDIYYCCATAAGPAFEGAEITMGMAAVSGAVNHIKWDDGLVFTVIGEKEPSGICGSGLLDALALLLETGAVDETGRLLDACDIKHGISEHIGKIDGKNVFRLSKNRGDNSCGVAKGSVAEGGVAVDRTIYISAMDIRKLQLAKAAISAGIQTLLQHAGITEAQVNSFILAGGFGSFMDKTSAVRAGLFPKSFLPITRTLGNAAGEGAALALCSRSARAKLREIRNKCEYVELSTSAVFNEQFIEQMMFEESTESETRNSQ